jgi:hypothetical protein
MMSISHWGMFEVAPRIFVLPAGFKLSEHDMAEWNRPDGMISLVPLEKGERQPVYIAPGWAS